MILNNINYQIARSKSTERIPFVQIKLRWGILIRSKLKELMIPINKTLTFLTMISSRLLQSQQTISNQKEKLENKALEQKETQKMD